MWEALVERNPLPYSDLKMTSCGPGQPPHENLMILFCFPISIKGKGNWDYNGSERWLPWTGYLVPIRTSRLKKRPHMMRMFVHNRAETTLPKHPSLYTQPSNTRRPLLGDPSSG
ncbi:hypothetical protein E2C01_042207 [Portunus trituberculatus]|uniref:Uncharacterized protein n=1 Tax=Portunus trituberculatus TaxID=210409 RepID=A0A5B7FVU8_PORTR|nr:hypothetical protein [Portunus trituberculatus]